MKQTLSRSRILSLRDSAVKFLNGNLYPFLVALFVLIGHVTALEFYFNIPIILSAVFCLIFSPTLKPFIIVLTTFLYQINLKHTPGAFYETQEELGFDPEYYTKPAILTVIIILALIVFSAIIYRFVRYSALRLRKNTPLLFPISLFCSALVLNGAFFQFYTVSNLFYGLAQVLVFFFIFYLFYFGLRDIPKAELVSYISYVALLNAMVLVGEMAFMYLTYENLFLPNGSILKEWINLGWSVSNPIAFNITVLMPMLAYGAMTKRASPIYFIATVACFASAILTLSKNAFVFSTLTFIACLVFGCIKGEKRKLFRIMTLLLFAIGAVFFIIFFDKIYLLFEEYLNRGFSDNGRFALWERAFECLLESPLFGVGFFNFGDIGTPTFLEILPTMAHNTIFVVMSSMGIFGLISYAYYRIRTVLPLIKRPTTEKTAFLLTLASMLAMSLLDNHVFYIHTMFYYSIILAVSVIITEREKEELADGAEL